MLRLQGQLDEHYTAATADELAQPHRGRQGAPWGPGRSSSGTTTSATRSSGGPTLVATAIASRCSPRSTTEAEFIVFCGVHFMAESADVLTGDHQTVILPDLNAGCSMADMADLDEVEEAWEALSEVTDIERVIPITYMNSSAALKAFVGRNGGAVCTSTNARAVLDWALGKGPRPVWPRSAPRAAATRCSSSPTSTSAATPGWRWATALDDMQVWNPRLERGGLTEAECKEATLLLWKGHCSVHQRFLPEHVEAFRAEHPDGIVVTHPECRYDTCQMADHVGSTDFIIRTVNEAPAGSVIGVGTEIHLVNRLNDETPDKTIVSLDPLVCPCSTMFRIDAPHLCWVLENLVEGEVVNRITVDPDTTEWAKVALQRMLEIV